jgi:hypothetical protein
LSPLDPDSRKQAGKAAADATAASNNDTYNEEESGGKRDRAK